jgi:hypothetical protein
MASTLYQSSPGVTYTISTASGTGWAGTATHVGLVGSTPSGCHIAMGMAASTASEDEGTPYCP